MNRKGSPKDDNGAVIMVPFAFVNRAQVATFLYTLEKAGANMEKVRVKNTKDDPETEMSGAEALDAWRTVAEKRRKTTPKKGGAEE